MITSPTRRRTPKLTTLEEPSQEVLAQRVRSLLAEAQALSARLAALNEIAAVMQEMHDLDSGLQELASQSRWLIDYDHCSIAMRKNLHYEVTRLYHDALPAPGELYPLTCGVIGRAIQQNHELLLTTLDDDVAVPAGAQSAVIVPLRREREIIGTLNFFSNTSHHYLQNDLRIAVALALQVSVIVQNIRLFNAVKQGRDELHTILESISDAVLVVNTQGRIVMLNRSLREMLQLPALDFVGRRALQLLGLAGESQPLLPVDQIRPLLMMWHNTLSQTANGALTLNDGRQIEWAYVPLGDDATRGSVFTLRDISARIELEQLRIDLTNTLVHDLRTPLTAIKMGIEMLDYTNTNNSISPLQAEIIIQLQHSTSSMIDHVNTILDVSKLEIGRLTLNYGLQELDALVVDEIERLLPIAQHAQQAVSNDIALSLPPMLIDGSLIRRVITNLLGNALKFTPIGGSINVYADITPAGDEVEIRVEDTGPGVSPGQREHIFEKYSQEPGSQQHNGSGLGLFFCRLAVEAHGGRIGMRPAPNGGSIFWFTLPISESA